MIPSLRQGSIGMCGVLSRLAAADSTVHVLSEWQSINRPVRRFTRELEKWIIQRAAGIR